MNSTAKTILFWVALLLTAVLLYQVFTIRQSGSSMRLVYSEFLDHLEKNNIKDVTITDSRDSGSEMTGHLRSPDNQQFNTVLPMADPGLLAKLREKNVNITGEKPNQSPWLTALFSWALPMLFKIGRASCRERVYVLV